MVETFFGNITFIDTPGHAVFSNMRKRGAQCTDLVVLVISAVEGVQSQTHEILQILQDTNIPFVIAINKIDVAKADPVQVEEDLVKLGVEIDTYGGNIPTIHISAVEQINTDMLLELLLFETKRLDIKGHDEAYAECVAMECKFNEESDRKFCSLIIRDGSLNKGDWVVAGTSYGKVLSMFDDLKNDITLAGPGSAVEITGLKELPDAGEKVFSVRTEKEAEKIVECRKFIRDCSNSNKNLDKQTVGTKVTFESWRDKRLFMSGRKDLIDKKYNEMLDNIKAGSYTEIRKRRKTIERTFDDIEESTRIHENFMSTFHGTEADAPKVILKASDYGTIETILSQMDNIKDKDGKINFEILKCEVGSCTENDLIECMEFDASIYCFDISPPECIYSQARREGIELQSFDIIYKMLDSLKSYNEELYVEKNTTVDVKGSAHIQQIFDIQLNNKTKLKVAGLKVSDGFINKNMLFRIVRNDQIVHEGLEVVSLKKFKKEVKDLKNGDEGGISFKTHMTDVCKGDIIECYTAKK